MSDAGGAQLTAFEARLRASLVALVGAMQARPGYRRFARALPGKVVVRAPSHVENARLRTDRGMPQTASGGELPDGPEPPATCQTERVLVAVRGRRVVGWALVKRVESGIGAYSGWWIWKLHVRLPYRGRGIAEKLVEEACTLVSSEGGDSLNLFVTRSNHAAMALYRKLGFIAFETPAIAEMLAQVRQRYGLDRCALRRLARPDPVRRRAAAKPPA